MSKEFKTESSKMPQSVTKWFAQDATPNNIPADVVNWVAPKANEEDFPSEWMYLSTVRQLKEFYQDNGEVDSGTLLQVVSLRQAHPEMLNNPRLQKVLEKTGLGSWYQDTFDANAQLAHHKEASSRLALLEGGVKRSGTANAVEQVMVSLEGATAGDKQKSIAKIDEFLAKSEEILREREEKVEQAATEPKKVVEADKPKQEKDIQPQKLAGTPKDDKPLEMLSVENMLSLVEKLIKKAAKDDPSLEEMKEIAVRLRAEVAAKNKTPEVPEVSRAAEVKAAEEKAAEAKAAEAKAAEEKAAEAKAAEAKAAEEKAAEAKAAEAKAAEAKMAEEKAAEAKAAEAKMAEEKAAEAKAAEAKMAEEKAAEPKPEPKPAAERFDYSQAMAGGNLTYLKKGSGNRDQVEVLQRALIKSGFMDKIPENHFGHYGNKTREAVVEMQKALKAEGANIAVDGKVFTQGWEAVAAIVETDVKDGKVTKETVDAYKEGRGDAIKFALNSDKADKAIVDNGADPKTLASLVEAEVTKS